MIWSNPLFFLHVIILCDCAFPKLVDIDPPTNHITLVPWGTNHITLVPWGTNHITLVPWGTNHITLVPWGTPDIF